MSQCLDMFVRKTISSELSKGLFVYIVLSVIGFILVLVTMAILIKHRTSPMGRAIDFDLSVLHLSLLALLFSLLPILTLLDISPLACSMKALVFATFYTLNIACIMTKSEKIVSAFNSRVFLTDNDVTKTKLRQSSIITLLLFLSFVLFAVMYKTRDNHVIKLEDGATLTRTIACNNTLQYTLQCIFFIFCHVLCAIPAYRGRTLPYVFNEAMVIVYTSFFCIVSFAAMFPIVHFQKDPIGESLVCLIVVMVNSLVTLGLGYMSKCYIMIWRPNKNTRSYFQSKLRPDLLETN